MDWSAPVDIYCERLTEAFWAEPLNAVSNIAFLVAAVLALRAWRAGARDGFALALIVLVFVIGIGSFLFHTFANRWSSLADVIPITLFIYAYLALALRRFVGLNWPLAIVTLIAFFGLTIVLENLLRPYLGGSAAYAPALLAMLGIGALLFVRSHPAARPVLTAGGVFLISLTLRTLDEPLCQSWPAGIHFLWHVLNAVTLGLLLSAATKNAPPKSSAAHH